jgi:hypothetical protein
MLQNHSRPGSGRPGLGLAGLDLAPATLIFDFFFSNGFCSDEFDFLIFSDGSCFRSCFLVFSLVFHVAPTTFRVIKSQKWLTFPLSF